MKKQAILKIAMCTVTAVLLAVSVSAYLDRTTGTVEGYATEGLIYEGLNNGYHASTYVNPSANYKTVWAKVELVTPVGTICKVCKKSLKNEKKEMVITKNV